MKDLTKDEILQRSKIELEKKKKLKEKNKDVIKSNKSRIIKNFLFIILFTSLIAILNIIFQKIFMLDEISDTSLYFLTYLIAIFFIAKYFTKTYTTSSFLIKSSLFLIICCGAANFIIRFIFKINAIILFGDLIIIISYLIFISHLTKYTYDEYLNKNRQKNISKKGNNKFKNAK